MSLQAVEIAIFLLILYGP